MNTSAYFKQQLCHLAGKPPFPAVIGAGCQG
jgi:hypothetical protein